MHVQMVERHLGSKMIVYDPSVSPEKQNLTYRWNGRKFDVLLNGVLVSDVRWVWFRKPKYPESASVPEEYLELTLGVVKAHVKLLYGILGDRNWLSDPWSIWRANNKLLQTEEARKVSFRIPDTLVTNSAQQAERFRLRVGAMVVKAVSPEVLVVDGKPHLFYTTYIPKDAPLDLSGLCVSPTIFQKAVDKGFDLRVTVVGDAVFACKITQTGVLEGEIDWRKGIGSGNLVYEPTELDPKLENSCVRLTKLLGLKFGAIDLVVDRSGDVWFLEINPNGQWGFVEEHTGLPISEAFASMFKS